MRMRNMFFFCCRKHILIIIKFSKPLSSYTYTRPNIILKPYLMKIAKYKYVPLYNFLYN